MHCEDIILVVNWDFFIHFEIKETQKGFKTYRVTIGG